MHEITCPQCGKAFTIDESGYADIVKQVRDSEFEQQLHERLELAATDKQKALELAESKAASELLKAAALKDTQIHELTAKLEGAVVAQKLAVTEALGSAVKERDALANDLAAAKQLTLTVEERAEAKLVHELQKAETAKNTQLHTLQAKLDSLEVTQKLAVTEAVGEVVRERDELKNGLEKVKLEKQLSEQLLKESHTTQLKDRDEAIERLRDMKAKLSTKMVGETLELHCETVFNQLRATAFPYAYFEKDNDSRTGSKGDYIFRDNDAESNEVVSIMFEMKNEADGTTTKHKNEDFLRELHKDRTEKGCEYAVLVTLLEPESALYNAGIVDVSHRYPKMYIVRPQFFIPIITVLRNAALNSMQYKTELALVKAQTVDVTNFEDQLEKFKSGFAKNFGHASNRFKTAVTQIDKAIQNLQATRDALLSSENQLRLANSKAQDVTIRSLTRGNKTMTEMFAEAKTHEKLDAGGADGADGAGSAGNGDSGADSGSN